MNDDQKSAAIMLGGLATVTVATIYSSIRIHKVESKKRKEIQENTKRELAALYFAGGIVHERVTNGHYDGKPVQVMIDDMEFETIAYLNK